MQITQWINTNPGVSALLALVILSALIALFLSARMKGMTRGIEHRIREGDKLLIARQNELASRIEADSARTAETLTLFHGIIATSNQVTEARVEKLCDTVTTLSETVNGQFDKMRESIEARQDRLTRNVNDQLRDLQSSNEKRLDQMRETVDQRLQTTLEKRLGESFQLVSKQLENVHQGLGEMQKLAGDVGSLQKVISGVKTRGTWGEAQLRVLLEQMLTPSQYIENAVVSPGSNERVEFAIILPGKTDDQQVLLPIDSKFPIADYERLVDASETGDKKAVDDAAKALERAVTEQAKKISDKYIKVPHTTDFAILFLPIESLYAEVLRRPGLASDIQQKYRVTISGPTTLTSLLNSLQMGFRTLAVEKRSLEIGRLLRTVKVEFEKFGDILSRTKEKLDQASRELEKTDIRTRKINKQLESVEELGTETEPLE